MNLLVCSGIWILHVNLQPRNLVSSIKTTKKYIQQKAGKLLSGNVTEHSFLPWQAEVLAARDGRHKPGMAINYFQTINRYALLDTYPLPNINEQVCEIAKGSLFSTLDLKSAYYQVPLCQANRSFTAFEADKKLYQYTRLSFGMTNGVSCFRRIVCNLIEKYELIGTFACLDNISVSGFDKTDHDTKLALCYLPLKLSA